MTVRPFAPSYREARELLLAAADAADLDVASHPHPLRGRDGEALALDVVRDGPADAASVLIVSSGCHGIEGYCGAGIQVALLGDAAFRAAARAAGVAVLYLHALNPWGFSWWRRVTQENVDLNRNFRDFHRSQPANPGYDALAAWLVPARWPPGEAVDAALAQWTAQHGEAAFQAAVTTGQTDHPDGLFYSGRNPTWSNLAVRQVLREQVARCRRLGWIDIHTGLGPEGHGEKIFSGRADDSDALARCRRWWGTEVTSMYEGNSTSAVLDGVMFAAAYDECPHAVYTGIALEYGTIPILQGLQALRADQWLENHPEADAGSRAAIKRRMFDSFFVDTPGWRARILEQGFDAAHRALRGLSVA